MFLESGGKSLSKGSFSGSSAYTPAIFQDSLFNQDLNGPVSAFVEHAGNVGYCQPVVHE
jgi:hypothetical protein